MKGRAMKRALLFLLVALGPPLSFGQVTGVINASNSPCVTINVTNKSTVSINTTETFSATLQPEVAIQGQAATNASVTPYGSTTSQSTITTANNFRADVAGADLFLVCVTSYVSGSVTVTLGIPTQAVSTGLISSGGASGGSLSGMTGGQVPIAATATTVTSSKAMAGSGSAIVTGPASSTSGDVVTYTGTGGQTSDSGTLLSSLAPLASPTFTGTVSGITASMVGLGSVTNNAQTQAAIVPNTAPSAGQILVGNAGGTAYAPVGVSGDVAMTSAGATTVSKINNTAFSGSNGDLVSFGAANIPADAGFLATNAVRKDAANTGAAAMTLDMSASSGSNAFKVPVAAGCTSGADGAVCYDSTAKNTHIRVNGADALAFGATAALAQNRLPKLTSSTITALGNSSIADTGTTISSTENVSFGTAGGSPHVDPTIGSTTAAMTAQSSATCTNVTGMTWNLAASKN